MSIEVLTKGQKISLALTGKKATLEARANMSKAGKGKKKPIGFGDKISKAFKGRKLSDTTQERISKSRIGIIPWNSGKKGLQVAWNKGLTTADARVAKYGKSVSKSMRGKPKPDRQGDKHWNWKNGLSCEKYPSKWNDSFKNSIRERDGEQCQLCGMSQIAHLVLYKAKLDVHHIDYNKKNLNELNLITLCTVCHGKTNVSRDSWKQYFQNKIGALLI